MDKNGVLTISDWQKGQAESPYLGFDTLRAVDITSTPGIAKISYKTEELSGFSAIGLPVAFCYDTYGNNYQLVNDSGSGNAVFYKNGANISSLAGTGWDMIYYKGYILIRHGTAISAYETTVAFPALFQAWKTGYSQTYYGKMLVSKNDGNVYIADGTTIKRLSNFVAGATSVAPTATDDTAISLITGYAAVTIAELGARLMVGTQTEGSFTTRYGSREAVIFPYRIGVSATNFDNPVTITNANCIQQIIVSNNLMYITAGMKGNVYVSDGTSYRQVKTIPYAVKDESGLGLLLYPNAITIAGNGNLLIGTTSFTNGYFGDVTQHGVWEINLATGKYETNLRYIMSNGNFTGNTQISIGFVFQDNTDRVYFGWGYGSDYGIDITNAYKYSGYTSTIESQVYVVGNKLTPKTFENVEILLGQPLTLGQGIRLSYRLSTSGDYTTIGTFDYATYGGVISIRDKALITNAQLLQVKIEMTTQSSTIGITPNQNIELMSVTLW